MPLIDSGCLSEISTLCDAVSVEFGVVGMAPDVEDEVPILWNTPRIGIPSKLQVRKIALKWMSDDSRDESREEPRRSLYELDVPPSCPPLLYDAGKQPIRPCINRETTTNDVVL